MNEPARELRYSREALRRDYLRAAAGIAMSVVLLLLVTAGSIASYLFFGFLALFAAFGAHTFLKQSTTILIDETGVTRRVGGLPGCLVRERRVSWEAMDRLVLRYFGRRRDRGRGGVVELSVGSGGERFTVDQALEGFDGLVQRARYAAKARGLELDSATEANLSALGFSWN